MTDKVNITSRHIQEHAEIRQVIRRLHWLDWKDVDEWSAADTRILADLVRAGYAETQRRDPTPRERDRYRIPKDAPKVKQAKLTFTGKLAHMML